jgi:uncharacterized protein (TIGR03435 family)
MKRLFTSACLIALISGMAFGQTTTASPEFGAADVHASAPTSQPFMQVGFVRGRFQAKSATMADLISTAWGVETDAVYGGPSWLDADRFDIIAKAPVDSSEADRALMLRALLADRFKLVIHNENKALDVFTLTAGKRNAGLKDAAGTGEADCQNPPNPGNAPTPYIVLNCKNMTMAEFAKQFRQMAGGYVIHPMVDLTGLTGAYDFTIKWTGRAQLTRQQQAAANGETDPNPGISFFDAVDKQLGLKLTPEKRPVPVIMVDSVNRTPTENAPGVSKTLPAAPTEFEVADIKPSKPDAESRGGFQPGGRIDFTGIPLKDLIGFAWDARDPNMIVGPKWIETAKYDMVAKAATGPGTTPPPIDVLQVMLKALLVDRFKITFHSEDQPMPVWTLTVSKKGLKLKEADPASRSTCKRAPGQTGTGTAMLPAIVYTYTNTTMAQLAEAMHQIAGGYVDHPAVDMTSLKGAYDFAITWTPKGAIMGGPGRGDGQPAAAGDPTGGITFFDAVEKLGLHLEGGQKHPMPVMVIDHVEPVTVDK